MELDEEQFENICWNVDKNLCIRWKTTGLALRNKLLKKQALYINTERS